MRSSSGGNDADSDVAAARQAVAFLGVAAADKSTQNENQSPPSAVCEMAGADAEVEMKQILPGARFRIGVIVMQPDGGIPHVIPVCQVQDEDGSLDRKLQRLGNVSIYYNATGRTLELRGGYLDKEYSV
uniref:Uncharacterized protein n=1 Tax=Anopheles dirus TaxID=7168 RepID=A0A182NMB7_9DIPT